MPELLAHGHRVRCLVRTPPTGLPLDRRRRTRHAGDLTDPGSLDAAFVGVDTIVYLVHSLDEDDFERTELRSAANVRVAAEAGVRHVVLEWSGRRLRRALPTCVRAMRSAPNWRRAPCR
ncbi:MAG: NAD(P)H-binding protein [Ilumatobacteraceae bacterium]